MTSSQWRQVVLAAIPPERRAWWAFRGQLAFQMPVGWVLRGILREPSGWGGASYVWAVHMPLTIPREVLALDYSRRVGGGTNAIPDRDTEGMTQAVGAAIAAVSSVEELDWPSPLPRGHSIALDEALAYRLILVGEASSARDALTEAVGRWQDVDGTTAPLARMGQVLYLLGSLGLKGATNQLRDWRHDTLESLRISSAVVADV